jgi:hypothetical protein
MSKTVIQVNVNELDNEEISILTSICQETLDSLNINSYFDIELSIILVNKERT